MKIAIAHDYLIRFGGAERVLSAMHKVFPDAPIYTLVFDERMRQFLPHAQIRTSFLNGLPKFLRKNPRRLLPILPLAAESFDLSEYDAVLSSSSAFIKGTITRAHTRHICYCHAPARFMWEGAHDYMRETRFPALLR